MTQNRSKRHRPLTLEALEGRLTLSSGMGMGTAAHAGLAHVSQIHKSVKASFTGRVQLNGSLITANSLKGTIGTDHFTGTGQVTDNDNHFQDGLVNLSNGKGTVDFALVPGNYYKVGKKLSQHVNLVVTSATGKYAPYLGAMGTVTKWNVPPRPNGLATIQATIPV